LDGIVDASLIFLYGPPAVGKYTVAKALTAELNWPLFHNHVVIDCVNALIQRGEDGFLDACADVRIALTSRALASGKSHVSTFVYATGTDDAFVARIRAAVDAARARFCAVRLHGSVETLNQRCVAPHRAPMKKIATVESLQNVLDQYDCFGAIPDIDSLAIDTDRSSVIEAVALIRAHFGI
jgi:predicted kinase